MACVILGDWTHRRADAGGTRSIPAEMDKPRPQVAWTWKPDHGGMVDQVRIARGKLFVATLGPPEALAPGWEHPVIYALDAQTGAETARRILPDAVPVAAMAISGEHLHVVATRRGEPIFWYALSTVELAAGHRRVVSLAGEVQHDDVLDAWPTSRGDLWLELEAMRAAGDRRVLGYALASGKSLRAPAALHLHPHDALPDTVGFSGEACALGQDLLVPVAGCWGPEATPAGLARLDGTSSSLEVPSWAAASLLGPRARVHAVATADTVVAVAAAQDPDRVDRVRVEATALDHASAAVKWRAQGDRLSLRPAPGEGARMVRRLNGEILLQSLTADGTPCSPVLVARSDGAIDALVLGARARWIIDAALGELVLCHRERQDGGVEVAGFSVDRQGRLLGRRAMTDWTLDVGELGEGATVYAGGGVVVARGARSLAALRF